MIVKLKHIFLFIAVLTAFALKAQDPNEKGNLEKYYHEKLHFGFTLGLNKADFMIHNIPHFERFDSLKTIVSEPKRGFNLGIVSDLRLHKYITLRFIPNLSFAERTLNYYYEGHDTVTRIKTIESTILNFPINLKLR